MTGIIKKIDGAILRQPRAWGAAAVMSADLSARLIHQDFGASMDNVARSAGLSLLCLGMSLIPPTRKMFIGGAVAMMAVAGMERVIVQQNSAYETPPPATESVRSASPPATGNGLLSPQN